MEHSMNLCEGPFRLIKNRTKTVEKRLFDEKRQKVNVGDIIVFTNKSTGETLKTEVTATAVYKDFAELYSLYDKISLGYTESEVPNPDDMLVYYSKEDIKKYGAFAISIKVI